MKTQEDRHMQAKDRPQKKSTLPILWFQISNLQTMFGLELLLFSGSPASNFLCRFWTRWPPQAYKPVTLHPHTHILPIGSGPLRNLDLHSLFFFFLFWLDVKKTNNTVLIIFLWWLYWCLWGFPHSSVGEKKKKTHLQCRRPWFNSWVSKSHWRRDRLPTPVFLGFPFGSAGKQSTCDVGDLVSIPELGRSPGEGKGYPLQYSGLENSMDCIVHGVTKSRTWLSDFHLIKYKILHFSFFNFCVYVCTCLLALLPAIKVNQNRRKKSYGLEFFLLQITYRDRIP